MTCTLYLNKIVNNNNNNKKHLVLASKESASSRDFSDGRKDTPKLYVA